MRTILFLSCVLPALMAVNFSAIPASAATLVDYTFGTIDNPTFDTTMELPGIDGSEITTPNDAASNVIVTDGVTITNDFFGADATLPIFRRRQTNIISPFPPDLTDIDANPDFYFGFTITANSAEVPGAVFDLTDVTVDFGPGGGTTRGFTLVDRPDVAGNFEIPGDASGTGGNSSATDVVRYIYPITGAENLTTAEFRFYTFGSDAGDKNLYFDNISVAGAVVVPEPSAILLLSGTAVGLLTIRRRRL
ncbi:MAG: PEP-CTERM sorting domain-containing protein [Chthoniobacteraceae bacterium]